MDAIRTHLTERTRLSQGDMEIIERFAEGLQVVSDLNCCDAFIDCVGKDGVVFVAAQSDPRFYDSRYTGCVVGQAVLPENEPAVYRAFERGVPIHDTMALTQENCTVRQDVAPIANGSGEVIGVVICERDVSREASLERKLDVAERERQLLFDRVIASEERKAAMDPAMVYVREAYHRIKNDLQMLASICNVRMRQAKEEETRLRLYEMSQAILAVASLHDALTLRETGDEGGLSVKALLGKIVRQIQALMPDGKRVQVELSCEDMRLRPKRAMPLALVLTELITNAVNHAFPEGEGRISVSVHSDTGSGSAVVSDNGVGIRGDVSGSKGLSIVSSLVTSQLEGSFSITSGNGGTRAMLTFVP